MLASPSLLFLVLMIITGPDFSYPAPFWDIIPRRQNPVNHEFEFLFNGLCTGSRDDFTHEPSPEACGQVCARDRPVNDV